MLCASQGLKTLSKITVLLCKDLQSRVSWFANSLTHSPCRNNIICVLTWNESIFLLPTCLYFLSLTFLFPSLPYSVCFSFHLYLILSVSLSISTLSCLFLFLSPRLFLSVSLSVWSFSTSLTLVYSSSILPLTPFSFSNASLFLPSFLSPLLPFPSPLPVVSLS